MIGLLVVSDARDGIMSTTPDPRGEDPLASYVDCNGFTWVILGLNYMSIGNSAPSCTGAGGFDCPPVPVPEAERTWGQIKAAF